MLIWSGRDTIVAKKLGSGVQNVITVERIVTKEDTAVLTFHHSLSGAHRPLSALMFYGRCLRGRQEGLGRQGREDQTTSG